MSKITLTKEDIEAGVTIEDVPDSELVNVTDKHLEQMARGFIMGSQALGKRREIRQELEKKVTAKIGRKGKYLTDKLFELIEGVYVVDKKGGKDGREIRYYQIPPSLNAIIYALDRVLGRPKVQIDKTEEKRGLILVEHVIRNLADNPYAKNGVRKNIGNGGSGNGGDAGDGGADPARVHEGAGQVAL